MRWLLASFLVVGCTKSSMDASAQGGVTRTAGCSVGTTDSCTCGAGSKGTRTCVTPEGLWTACGCSTAGGSTVAVPPEPPAPQVCGSTTCGAFTEEDSEVGAKGCCTTSGACGSKSKFLFGAACVERGGPVGPPAPTECPDESIEFLDLDGCCRPDGACGLTIDSVPNFDLGCIERTAMQKLVNEGSADRDLLTTLSFRAPRPASFPAMRCTPKP